MDGRDGGGGRARRGGPVEEARPSRAAFDNGAPRPHAALCLAWAAALCGYGMWIAGGQSSGGWDLWGAPGMQWVEGLAMGSMGVAGLAGFLRSERAAGRWCALWLAGAYALMVAGAAAGL